MTDIRLKRLADTVEGLTDAAEALRRDAPDAASLRSITNRGEFRPAEDEAIGYWFARFLSVREALWPVIDDARDVLDGRPSAKDADLPWFVVGYAAACILVGIDRKLLFDVAQHSIIQRKLNEPFPELRIPRKQYTRIFEAFVDEAGALALLEAMRFAKRHRHQLDALSNHPEIGEIAAQLPQLETALDPSKREYFRGLFAFISHKWRRRGVVTANNVLAGVSEGVGRVASEFYQSSNKKVTDAVRDEIGAFLQPGDVLVTRHAVALTNLFMPGFWPHAALYIGDSGQRDALGVDIAEDKLALWRNGICTLEALKDGVRLRPLTETLNVDYFVVLRPQVSSDVVSKAISRAVAHEGKPYNFDFDFFSSDRLVCTEVIYRAYDGIGGIEFPLTERAGRKTLSAEDLLDFARNSDLFKPVAIFGTDGCDERIAYDGAVEPLLRASYAGSSREPM